MILSGSFSVSARVLLRPPDLIQYALRMKNRLDRSTPMKRLLALLITVFLVPSFSVAQVVVVRAGRLVDPDSGTVLTDQKILVVGNKISAVGKELHIPADAKWIDLSDKTVLPGLIDCHTHLADGQGGSEPFNVLQKTASQIALESVPIALLTMLRCATRLRAGTSSARACMWPELTSRLRAGLER